MGIYLFFNLITTNYDDYVSSRSFIHLWLGRSCWLVVSKMISAVHFDPALTSPLSGIWFTILFVFAVEEPSFTAKHFSEFASESAIHPSVYKRIYCIWQINKETSKEFNISWQLLNDMEAPYNNDHPKWDPAYHEREHNHKERLTQLQFLHGDAWACCAPVNRRWHSGIVLSDHLCNLYVAEYCSQ